MGSRKKQKREITLKVFLSFFPDDELLFFLPHARMSEINSRIIDIESAIEQKNELLKVIRSEGINDISRVVRITHTRIIIREPKGSTCSIWYRNLRFYNLGDNVLAIRESDMWSLIAIV